MTTQEDEDGHVRVTAKAFWTRPRQDSLCDVSEAILQLRVGVFAEGRLSGPELEGRLLDERPLCRRVAVELESTQRDGPVFRYFCLTLDRWTIPRSDSPFPS